MSKHWYSIEAKVGEKRAEIHIFDIIGEWGISARHFVNDLRGLEANQIDLHINSPGGAVFDGVAIQNSLKHHKAKVTTYIDGIAGSIASIIALAGDEVQIADNAYVMIHNPVSMTFGESTEFLKAAEMLEKIADGMARDYSRKMGIKVEEARDLMDSETWYLGEEAVAAGFADRTFEGVQAAANFELHRFSCKAPQAAIDQFSQVTPPVGGNPKSSDELNSKENESMSDENTTAEVDADNPADQTPETVAESDQNPEQTSAPDVAAEVEKALVHERKRTAAITALGSKFGFEDDSKTFVENGKSVEDFRAHILSKSPDAWRDSLAVKNPAHQATESDESEESEESKAAVATIKSRRQAMYANN